MKKILILILMIFIVGCSKKYVKVSEEPVTTEEAVMMKEEARMSEEVKPEEREVIKEDIYIDEEKIGERQVVARAEPEVVIEEKEKEKIGERQVVARAEPEVVTEVKEKVVFEDVLFDFDRYDIRPDARPILESIAAILTKNNNLNIIIEGHCDERGTNEYNLALGEKRAKAVKDYLVALGVPSTRMDVITYGEEKPVCTERNEECWQKNRRVHFVVVE